MGITDGAKSSAEKSNTITLAQTSAAAETNGCHESAIPQMVLTSVEGESEELKLENDLPCLTITPAAEGGTELENPPASSTNVSSCEENGQGNAVQIDVKIQDQYPVEIPEPDTHKPMEDDTHKPAEDDSHKPVEEPEPASSKLAESPEPVVQRQADGHEPVIQRQVDGHHEPVTQRPLLVNGSGGHESKNIAAPTSELPEAPKSVVTTGHRPLCFDAETAKKEQQEAAALPVESIYEVIEPKHSDQDNEVPLGSENKTPPETTSPTSPKESDGFFARSKTFWKQDAKPLFTFPKFHFSSKEPKESSKSSKKEQSKKQELPQEAVTEPQPPLTDHPQEEKLGETVPKLPEPPPAPQPAEPKKTDRSSLIHPGMSELNQKNKAVEDDFNLQEEPVPSPAQSAKRATTPESLYDTCCIRFAVLLRNKAYEIAAETSKSLPPKKPPKPSAEALAKARSEITAKRLKEYQSRPHNFGDDILVGIDGIRYADEDTESSTDYKDVDNVGVILNPECYGIIRKMKSENEADFRAPSTCSGLTSYYTADTVTLKDENSSDNTLETISLGSYDSVVCRAAVLDQKGVPTDGHDLKSESCPCTMRKAKKVPPPVPPKPTVLLKSLKKTTSSPTSAVEKFTAEEEARCINSLSLSPRPFVRKSSPDVEGIKKRPLTIAGIKTTEFEQFSQNKSFESSPKKPVLNTVVKNSTLQKVRNLPVEPHGFCKTLDLPPKPRSSESPSPKVISKPPPPPRPPPPVKPCVVVETPESPPQPKEQKVENIVAPPRRSLLPRLVSPPRPSPPAKQSRIPVAKPPVPPPRPPPPSVVAVTSHKPTAVVEEVASVPSTQVMSKESVEIVDQVNSMSDAKISSLALAREITNSENMPEVQTEPVLHLQRDGEPSHTEIRGKSPDLKSASVSNLEDEKQQEHVTPPARQSKCPRPPPRVRRKRSRTVEIVSLTDKVQENRRRSQSLSDIEEKRTLLSPEDPVKALYTTVNKELKNGSKGLDSGAERLSSSSETISGRPLPAPPPPPRSKSRSSSRRSKSDERPNFPNKLLNEECSLSKSESMPSEIDKHEVKPPTRKKKSSKEQFFSLRSQRPKHEQISKFYSLRSVNECSSSPPPVKPERRMKTYPAVQFDENANVANPSSVPFGLNPSDSQSAVDDAVARPRVKSLGFENIPSGRKNPPLLQRSKSDSRKSHSSWYDNEIKGPMRSTEEEEGEWEKVDWPPSVDAVDGREMQMKTPPRHKKGRKSSTFYVNVGEEKEESESSAQASGTLHEEKENESTAQTSGTLREDKETSPLPLDYSEKSVQTSLETLSIGAPSRGEMSDDTDDLLDLAQTLQDELKTIIKRHKSGEVFKSSDESCSTSEASQSHKAGVRKKPTSLVSKPRAPLESSASSTSEIWQISSSEESEDDCTAQEAANLSEISRTKKKRKVFYIAQEIMSSEEAFVDALRLLNVDFRAFVEKVNLQRGTPIIPEEVINQILNHLPQLQHLNENLLMELKYRIEQWENINKIADIIVKMGPFLKLYSWYIQDFESTTSVLEDAKKKYPLFGQAVKEYEASSRCKRLTLNHYMLKPVQRIPQYRLLLQEYLHHLPTGSEDYDDTVEALRIVSEVANHANESMKHGDNFQKLISIQSSIIGHKEIIKPGRRFIKEGELMKLSRKGMQPRWFVLMNDLLLYLTPVQQGLYRVNHELTLAGMKVAIPLQQDYQNEFSIISVTRSFTLSAKSHEERQEWIVALTKAIEENASKRSTFTAGRLQQKSQTPKDESLDQGGFVLGKTAPVWIPDARVTMCQLCTSEFTVTFRRHHCRACGKVVCSICSSNRISLQYLGNRIARVCDECYTKLGQVSSGCTESGETDSDNQQIAVKAHLRTDRHKKLKRQLPSVLKEVCANDIGSTISGYIYKRVNSSWKKSWFVVKEKVLYEFRASEDVAALRSIPLLGFQINTFTEPFEGIDSSLMFEISHPGQAPILFHAETPGSAERWIKELKDATVLE